MSEAETPILIFTNGLQETGEHKPIKKIKLHQTMSKAEIDALVEGKRNEQKAQVAASAEGPSTE